MDTATVELYLQKIKEYIYDEDKIITFTWLSDDLGISVKDCKNLLKSFVADEQELKRNDLALTYTISGELLNNKGFAVILVDETDLENKKLLFKKVSSEILYSVQKGKNVDLDALSLVDVFDINNPREKPLVGSIVDKNCVKREVKSKTPVSVQPPEQKAKPNLFSNVPKKTQPSSVEPKPENNSSSKPQIISTKKNAAGGLANFFQKAQSNKKESNAEQLKEKSTPLTKNVIEENKAVKSAENECMDVDNEMSSQSRPTAKTSKKRARKNNKQNETSKRRKRIVENDSSDSDDIFGNNEESEDEVIVDSEEEEKIKPMIKIDMNAPKNKRRKLVNKTYTDEDGYILTRKEWVYESCSDDEKEQNNPQIAEKQIVEQPKPMLMKKNSNSDIEMSTASVKNKGKKSKQIVNQPSIMNFFKRT